MSELSKLDSQLYSGGCNSDTSVELVQSNKGECIDSRNMRRGSSIGNKQVKEKISGEQVLYSTYILPSLATVDLSGYTCLCFTSCKGHQIAVWASQTGDPAITIDDKIVAQDSELGFTYDHPIQSDVNESCVGGEFYLTDFNIPPYIFNMQDMLDNYAANTNVYFSGFNPYIYSINLAKQTDQPVFTGYEILGTGNGLIFGTYAYAIRYVDASGNRSAIGVFSPLIPVIARDGDDLASSFYCPQFPNHLTRGGHASASYSQYGINLKYRVTNTFNYSAIEIVRIAYNQENPLGYPVSAEYHVENLALTPGQLSVEPFRDQKTTEWLPLTEEEQVQVFSAIECAKAIRYYDNRLVLMNVKYVSKDISDTNIELTDGLESKAYPVIQNMGIQGHSDPKNATYYRSYPTGEKYGLGVLVRDTNGEKTLVLPLDLDGAGDSVYTVPNRRKKLSIDSENASVRDWKGAVRCSNINGYNNNPLYITPTHEVFNLVGRGSTSDVYGEIKPAYAAVSKSIIPPTVEISIHDGNFNPLRPRDQEDTDTQGHQLCVQDGSWLDGSVSNPLGHELTDGVFGSLDKVFAPEFYSQGIGINGLKGFPAWASSFSIVRTKPVGRLISQGIAVYPFSTGSTYASDKSNANVIYVYFPDEAAGYNVDSLSSASHVQFVSPLGFHTEAYNGFTKNAGLSPDEGIDLMVYARLLYNDTGAGGQPTNMSLQGNDISNNPLNVYWTEFGAWRNADINTANPFYDNAIPEASKINGDKEFPVTGVVSVNTDGAQRFRFYKITVTGDVWKHLTSQSIESPGNAKTNDVAVKEYHEPFYIVNLINKNAELPDSNMTTYYEVGHNQKIESIIGEGNGSQQNLPLCDERPEDCIPSRYSNVRTSITSFITIRDKNTNAESIWMDVTYNSNVDTIIATLNATGEYVVPQASVFPSYETPQAVTIKGIYTSDWNITSDEDGRDAIVQFLNRFTAAGVALDPIYCIPQTDNYIIVKYDNRFPLKVYGGDVVISEDSACFLDGYNDLNGDEQVGYKFSTPFPYNGFRFSLNYKRVKKAHGGTGYLGNFYQNETDYGMHNIRQFCVDTYFETKCHIPYSYQSSQQSDIYPLVKGFPKAHYVMRPEKWNSTIADNFSSSGDNIDDEYNQNYWYPQEVNYLSNQNWGYGGFRCGNIFDIDYAKYNNYSPSTSKPIVGWKEITEFCTRIIWSEQRNISQQNAPNLKTFLGSSYFDLEDAYGEIKYAYNAETSKGDNLYAFTEKGLALLLTGKEMVGDTTGTNIALISVGTQLINNRIWLRNDVGMNAEMWRSAAEWAKTIFWANNESVFTLFDNKVTDIGRNGYRRRIYYDGLNTIKPDYDSNVCAVFNRHNSEYWLDISQKPKDVNTWDMINTSQLYILGEEDNGVVTYLVTPSDWLNIQTINVLTHTIILPTDFVEGDQLTFTNSTGADINIQINQFVLAINATTTYEYNGSTWEVATTPKLNDTFVCLTEGEMPTWDGTFDYNFEKLINIKEVVYGVRDGKSYIIGTGFTLNGTNITGYLRQVCNAQQLFDKEFISIAVNASNKPTRINFSSDKDTAIECSLYSGMSTPANTYYLKEYGKGRFTNKIPRKLALDRDRLQGKYMVFEIIHDTAEEFTVVDSLVDYKPIKLQI